jgi:hypothetical protein
MAERKHTENERGAGGPSSSGDSFGGDDTRLVTVSHGPYAERLPAGEMTVREIRARYRDRLDIDPDSQAVVDGREVSENVVVRGGEMVMFVRKAGEKGPSLEGSWSL